MKLTTVLSSVNNNSEYYLFIPKQIIFWRTFNIKFLAVYIGEEIPNELLDYTDNIILWNKNLNINTSYVGQNLRIYYPALLNLGEDELVMITDMDMLPMNDKYYKDGLDNFTKQDFIYLRNIDVNQIYMCYNLAHPSVWSKVFNVKNEDDIEKKIAENYIPSYTGIPGGNGWCTDQHIMYNNLINYPFLKVLNRPIKRLETCDYINNIKNGDINFISKYDDCHFHRSFIKNKFLIENAENQLNNIYTNKIDVIKRQCVFTNDNNVIISLINHQFSNDMSRRDNHEVLFRRINTYLLNNNIININKNIIDLGSWIGDNSIPWSKNIKGKVYAIDPSPINLSFINETCILNNIHNVSTLEYAISNLNELLSTNEDINHCSFVYGGVGTQGRNKVNAVSLDYLYEKNIIENIGYIHLDVEGMEFKVLQGSSNILDKEKPIITFEQHLEIDNYNDISSYLKGKNYHVFLIDEILNGCRHDCRNSIAFHNEIFSIDMINNINKFIGKNILIPK